MKEAVQNSKLYKPTPCIPWILLRGHHFSTKKPSLKPGSFWVKWKNSCKPNILYVHNFIKTNLDLKRLFPWTKCSVTQGPSVSWILTFMLRIWWYLDKSKNSFVFWSCCLCDLIFFFALYLFCSCYVSE